jgi:lactate dehydrogenase-like 2-hydroxyacid dehydrogenase
VSPTERPPSVILAAELPDASLARLAESCQVIEVLPAVDAALFAEATPVADGIIVTSRVRLDGRFFDTASKLRVVSTISVGLDHIDLGSAARHGITVTTTPVLTDAVADLVLALMVMLARRLPESAGLAASGRWQDAPLGHDLANKRLLIVGLGRIGREVARRALAFRMQVAFFDRQDLFDTDGLVREEDLHSALGLADFVSLHVDLNSGTRHLIGAEELALMKPTAYLVNAARGGIVDQAALRDALAAGRLAGAALDVLEEEPPDVREPLLAEPRAIVLPHIGSATTETRAAMAALAVDNMLKCLSDQSCTYVVGPPLTVPPATKESS